MTTIAIKDAVVAVDTQATGSFTFQVRKLVRLPSGEVATGCGEWRKVWAGLQWLAEGQRGEPPEIDGAEILIVGASGNILIAEGMWPPYPIMETVYATGTGCDVARVALAEGLSPVEAVMQAITHDHCSGGPVLSLQALAVEWPDVEVHKVRKRK